MLKNVSFSVASSNVLVVGSLLSSQNQECRNTTRLFIPHERSNSTQDFTTSSRYACNYTWPPSLLNKHGLCQIHVTSLWQFNKYDLCRYFTKPPSFSRDLRHTPVNTTDARNYSLNTLGKNTPIRLYTLQQKVLELSGSTNKVILQCKAIYSSRRNQLK